MVGETSGVGNVSLPTYVQFGVILNLILSPTSRQCKKTILHDGVTLNLEGIFYGENRKIESNIYSRI